MRKDLLIIALGLCLAGPATADVLTVPEENQAAMATPQTLPAKGITMAAVEKQFGAPRDKHAPRGGDTPKHPPITRWDYDGFSVFFEHDRVVDAVIPGKPPRVYNKDLLTPVSASAAPPAPMVPAAEEPPAAEESIVPAPEGEAMPEEAPAEAAAMPAEPDAAPAEPDAAPEGSATEESMMPADETPPASAYPDRPPAETAAEEPAAEETPPGEIPSDQPPTPK